MKCFVCENTTRFLSLKPKFCESNNNLCLVCGLVFIPRERSYQNYYKEDGYFKKSPNLSLKKELISKSLMIKQAEEWVAELLLLFKIRFQNKSILEVGCAYGEILYYLKNKFQSKVLGIEPSRETALLGKKIFNVPIRPYILEEFNTKLKFDIIICRHTLEHVDNPISFLNKMKKLLKVDGLLYIEVPNILKPSGGFSLNKFLYNEHLQTFSSYSLFKLFNVCKINTYSYSDTGFLKFFCGTKITEEKKIPVINSDRIIYFLNNYKKNYSYYNYLEVYLGKLRFLFKIIYFKINDFILAKYRGKYV